MNRIYTSRRTAEEINQLMAEWEKSKLRKKQFCDKQQTATHQKQNTCHLKEKLSGRKNYLFSGSHEVAQRRVVG
jgi:hypothetical protein